MADEEEFQDGEQVEKTKRERVVRREVIRECDAPSQLAKDIIEFANQAMDEGNIKQKNMAQYVKAKLDKEVGGTWHVITGNHFGGNITNDAGTLVNFQLDGTWFLVFRSGPPEKKAQDE